MLTSKQRAYLRSIASVTEAIMQIGKGGVNENLITQTDDALRAREIIKYTVLESAPCTPREAAEILAEKTNSEVVQIIGRKLVLYRQNPDKAVIKL